MSNMRGTLRAVKGRDRYWEIAVDAGRDPVSGKRLRVVRGIHGGKRDAERALNQLVIDVGSGRASASTATVADLLDRWLDNVGSTLSPRTLQGYRRVVDQRLVPSLGANPPRHRDGGAVGVGRLRRTGAGSAAHRRRWRRRDGTRDRLVRSAGRSARV